MAAPTENEIWIIEAGDWIIQKKARSGLDSLTAWERLVYCLWVADYGMRNAGDLETARDVYADFQTDARRAAEELSLRLAREAFSMPVSALEEVYFERFDAICNEIKSAGKRKEAGGQ